MREVYKIVIVSMFLVAFLLFPMTAIQAEDSIKIGFMAPMSGFAAQLGKDAESAARLYLEEIGYEMSGRKVELLVEDSEALPATALNKCRKLTERDQVDVIVGPVSTATAVAVAPYVDSKRMPMMQMSSANILTQKKKPKWAMRISWATCQAAHPFADYTYKKLGYRNVVMVGMDYGFGWDFLGAFHKTFEELGGQVLKKIWIPYTAADTSPYISSINKDADAVVTLLVGRAAVQFLKQYQEAGLTLPIIGAGTGTDETVLPAMGDEALGIITALHYSAVLDNPANKAFSKKFQAKAKKDPSYYAEEFYVAMRWIDQAVAALKGDISNKDKFLKALLSVRLMNTPRGPMKIDAYGNPIQNVYMRKVERVGGKLQNTVIYTYPEVSQFWTYDPGAYIKQPLYSQNYPPIKK